MKQKLLKVLLLSSALTMIAGCGSVSYSEATTSVTPSEAASEAASETPSVTPSETPSAEASETPSEVVSEETSVGPNIDSNVKVELARSIYVVGEELEINSVSTYSKALDDFKPATNYTVTMPETCPNGLAYATVAAGTKSTDVPFYYYDDVETAVANTQVELPADTSTLFDEASYIKDGTLQFQYLISTSGELLTSQTSSYISPDKYNKSCTNQNYNTMIMEFWDEKGAVAATLDSSKKTIAHYVDDNGTTQTCATYQTTNNPDSISSANSIMAYEMIVDGNGTICYFAPMKWGSYVDLTTGEYWSAYKDYTQNPAIVLGEHYDATTNPYDYEKILPEGGVWIVGYNNAMSTVGQIDKLYQLVTGETSTIYAARDSFQLTYTDEETGEVTDKEKKLLSSGLKFVVESNKRRIRVYSTANIYEKYAYLYSQALASGDAAKLAPRDEIYNAFLMVGIDQVKDEKILYDYYSGIVSTKLDAWEEMFTA